MTPERIKQIMAAYSDELGDDEAGLFLSEMQGEGIDAPTEDDLHDWLTDGDTAIEGLGEPSSQEDFARRVAESYATTLGRG